MPANLFGLLEFADAVHQGSCEWKKAADGAKAINNPLKQFFTVNGDLVCKLLEPVVVGSMACVADSAGRK